MGIAREAARIARTLRSWEEQYGGAVNAAAPRNRPGALNLAHTILFRAESARLERMLEAAGLRTARDPLSILPETEFLESVSGNGKRRALAAAVRSRMFAQSRLDRHTTALLGRKVGRRRTRLIVNAGGETADTAAMAARWPLPLRSLTTAYTAAASRA